MIVMIRRVGGLGALLAALWLPVAAAPSTAAAQQDAPTLAQLSDRFEDLVVRVGRAVVQISASGLALSGEAASRGESVIQRQEAGGSGVIVDPAGYIVTNAHVVEGASSLQVVLAEPAPGPAGESTLKPQGETLDAILVGIDRETDIAVLKIEKPNLPFLEWADSENLRPGQLVLAFGSPLGLANSVSMGVVSAVARQLRPEDPMIYIQTDAAVNPGNSGGPLVDVDGRIAGINTFILSQSGGNEGISFASPAHIVRSIYNQIRSFGRVRRGIVGLSTQTINPTLAAGLSLPQAWGVLVSDVIPFGPASSVGMAVGDIIVSLDGKPMENARQFDVNIYGKGVGQIVTLEVLRDGTRREFAVRVAERPDFAAGFSDLLNADQVVRELAIYAVDLLDVVAYLPTTRLPNGVVVAAGVSGGVDRPRRFRPGDVIHSVNGMVVNDLTDLRSELAKLAPGEPVVFQVERLGDLTFVGFEVDW